MTHDVNKDIIVETPAVIEENITPRDLMKFAKSILLALATVTSYRNIFL